MEYTDDITWALDTIRARQADYATAADYYAGRHRLAFATDKFRNAFGQLLSAFADNLCGTVVDTAADRLQVTGFASEDGSTAVSAAANALWVANRMDRRSGEVHLEALTAGDAYVIVWPDAAGMPRIYPQLATLCAVLYDDETPGRVIKGAKIWLDVQRRWRLNLYYPDAVCKFATAPRSARAAADWPSRATAFQVLSVPGEPWPLPNPWDTVPILHFANNAFTGAMGRSELADVIPLQDGLNKSVADMLVAMEFTAFPQRYVTGVETEIDPDTGRPRALFVPGADRIWSVGAPDAAFGQFSQADLTQFVAVQAAFRAEIAIVSRTPYHYLTPATVAYPSGEALKTAEMPLLAKVRDRQIAFGNVWEDAVKTALTMQGQAPSAGLICNWQDASPRNERTLVETLLLKKQIGVSDAQLLREAGYSDEQIAQFVEERQVEQADLGEAMLRAFDRNQVVQGGNANVA